MVGAGRPSGVQLAVGGPAGSPGVKAGLLATTKPALPWIGDRMG
jgi:hypothetical protein